MDDILISMLSSGSKGNATIIKYKDTTVLIDIGTSLKYVENNLEEINIDINKIDAVLITHSHTDHIFGLKTFVKKYNSTIYLCEDILNRLDYNINNYSYYDSINVIKDMTVTVFKTSHDTTSYGFIIKAGTKEIVYITDTGYINSKYFDMLKNKNIYIIESNHDIELLNNGKYPHFLKMRILGDKGHLSNKDTSYYLSNHLIGENTTHVLLAHLSSENNTKELTLKH